LAIQPGNQVNGLARKIQMINQCTPLKIPVDTSFFSLTADWESRKLTKITMTGNERKSLKRAINDPDLLISNFLI
jgi:hypothetical protein